MPRWKRPYRDWRLVAWYPLLVLTPAVGVYAGLTDAPWIVLPIVGLLIVWLWRTVLVGVLLDGERIKVRNLLRTHIFRWGDVAEVDDGMSGGGYPKLAFVLKSGERVDTLVTTITHAGYEVYLTRGQFFDLVSRLRRQLAASKAAA